MAAALMNRGRTANSPQDIPAKGWKDVLMRVKSEINKDKISVLSAAMAYYALFSFIPAISSVIVVYAWISDPAEINQHMEKISGILPAEARGILSDQLTALASKASGTLGLSAIGGLLFSLYSASKGSKALMESLNQIYEEKESRGFLRLNLMALSLTLLATICSLLAVAVVIIVPAFFGAFNMGEGFEIGVTAASWLGLLTLFSLYLALVYRFGPSRQKPKWRWVSWGAVFSAVLFAIASGGFSWYAASFGNFNKTYGSLGAVIGLMMWFFISSYVILIGAEVNAELEHQTTRDSTAGVAKPMGVRGATMADTLGETAEEGKASKSQKDFFADIRSVWNRKFHHKS